MTRGPIAVMNELLARRRGHPASSPSGSDEAVVPWTFNQVLQPIILVLTFVILTQIIGYKRSYQRMRKIVVELLAGEHGAKAAERIAAVHNAQLYKLLLALKQVQEQRRHAWRAALFPDATRIQRDGAALDDGSFREFCDMAMRLSQDDGLGQEVLAIYRDVLARAEIRDPSDLGQYPQRRTIDYDELSSSEVWKLSPEELEEVFRTQSGVISSACRSLIQNAILDFCDGTRRHAADVQADLVGLLWADVLDDPDQLALSEQNRKIVLRMLEPNLTDADRHEEARKLHRNLVDEWRVVLEGGKYQFLIWDSLRSAM